MMLLMALTRLSVFLLLAASGALADAEFQANTPPQAASGACPAALEAFRAAQFERAAELSRACIQQRKEDSETYKLLALSSYMLKRVDDYRENLEKALALNPNDADAHYHLGRFHFERKEYRNALERFRNALTLDPENFKAYYYSGLCRQGNNEEGAQEDFRKAIEIIERKRINYGWPFSALGEMFTMQGDFERGLSWHYRAIRNDPTLPYTHFSYASALLKKEANFEVEQELQRAVKLDPGYTEAYYLLGRYYTKIGDKERAGQAFSKFEELRKNPVPSPFGLRR
jgi:tetratricopeptide (TPR) repeat protein